MKPIILLFLFLQTCNTSVKMEKKSKTDDSLKTDSTELRIFIEDPIIQEIDTVLYELSFSPKGSYYTAKTNIKKRQLFFREDYMKASSKLKKDSIIKEAGKFIDEAILNSIIPFWYGTEWDFSGYTHKPKEGFVGCSYFVSTTLKHSGFNLNRYHLAQQNPENEAKSLQINDSLLALYSSDNIIEDIETLTNGLYFVGLDSHVGYLLIRKQKAFFINSNYMPPLCVEIQYAEIYPVFESNIYHIVAIGSNKRLMKKWILGDEIAIVKRK